MLSHSCFTFASDRTPHIYSKWVFQQVPSQGFLDLTFPSSFASPADGTSKQGVNVKPIFEAGLGKDMGTGYPPWVVGMGTYGYG